MSPSPPSAAAPPIVPGAPTKSGIAKQNERLQALGLMTLASALFAAMNLLAHQAASTAPVNAIALARASVGASVAYAVGRRRSGAVGIVPLFREATMQMWGRSVFGTLAMTATFYALGNQALPVGDAATLFNLAPFGVALLAPHILREPTSKRLWAVLPFAALGVICILQPSFLGLTKTHPLPPGGVGLAVLAASFSALAMVLLRSINHASTPNPSAKATMAPPHSPDAIALHFSGTATVVFLVVCLATGSFDHFALWRSALPSMVAAGACAGFAQLAMTAAYQRDSAARVAALGYLNVPFSAALFAVTHKEIPTPLTLFGMGIVVVAGVSLSVGNKKSA